MYGRRIRQPSLDVFGQQKTRKRLFMGVSWISLDVVKRLIGAAATE
jgi:hypothetical protein